MFNGIELQNHACPNQLTEGDEVQLFTIRGLPLAIFLLKHPTDVQKLNVSPSTTIAELQSEFKRRHNDLSADYVFYAGKHLVDPEATITSGRIYHLSTVECFDKECRVKESSLSINIWFRGVKRKVYTMKGGDSVQKLENKITSVHTGISHEISFRQVRLTYKGKLLDNYKLSLSSYFLKDNADLILADDDDRSTDGLIRINIKVVPTGKTLQLEVRKDITICDLKSIIKDREEIPVKHQILYFPLRRLNKNSYTLSQYVVEDGSELHLVYSAIRTYVQIGREVVSLWTEEGYSVKICMLKEKIKAKKGYPCNRQKLYLHDVELRDEETIETSGVYSNYKLLCKVTEDVNLVDDMERIVLPMKNRITESKIGGAGNSSSGGGAGSFNPLAS